MKVKSLLNWKLQLAFGAAIFALLVVGAVSYRGIIVSKESGLWVRHTHEVLEDLKDLLLATESMKASAGEFVLTGKDSYLEAYHASRAKAEQDRMTLRNLTADNPRQQRLIPELGRLSAQQIELSEKVIDLRQRREGGSGFLAFGCSSRNSRTPC